MTATYDLSTDVGKVRLLIPDTDVDEAADALFSNEEISALLGLEGDSVRRAAALALETLASSEAYVQKVIRLQDLQTNGAQTAKALMERAAALRKQADDADAADDEAGLFDWAEHTFSGNVSERIWNQGLRTYG